MEFLRFQKKILKSKNTWWPVTGGSTLVASVRFTSKLTFLVHILGDKKKVKSQLLTKLGHRLFPPTKGFMQFCFHSKIESLKIYKKKLLIGSLHLFIYIYIDVFF